MRRRRDPDLRRPKRHERVLLRVNTPLSDSSDADDRASRPADNGTGFHTDDPTSVRADAGTDFDPYNGSRTSTGVDADNSTGPTNCCRGHTRTGGGLVLLGVLRRL